MATYVRRANYVLGIALTALITASYWNPMLGCHAEPPSISHISSLFLEELNTVEVQERIKQGATRVIVPTGGIEQNGPYVALNKHDLIVKAVSHRVAEILGNTLVAPVVPFVPEGNIKPPSGHMRLAGTISLSEETFVRLLHDIGLSLSVHGFKEIILVGDSGDSQTGLQKARQELAKEVEDDTRVRFLPEFYNYESIREVLRSRGFPLTPERFHEELPFTLQLLALDPDTVRYFQRRKAGALTLNGTSLEDLDAMVTLGKEIIEIRAQMIAKAIQSSDAEPD